MKIVNCTPEDIPLMQEFYDIAREYQKSKNMRHWLQFDEALLTVEINEQRQWKIMEGETVACIFMTAYQDPFIWGERDKDPSVYIHRIVTHPDWHGRNYTRKIIDWAKEHAKSKDKKFLRMDTWGDNPKLIDYYTGCGFNYIETLTPESTANLPAHYSCISLSLFQIDLD
jgi:GNAT superfamily N-acetyltransferase